MRNRIWIAVAAATMIFAVATHAIAAQELSSLQKLSDDLTALVKSTSPSVVEIRVQRGMPKSGTALQRLSLGIGSGFVVDPAGYILTTAQVAAGAGNVTVRFDDGTETDAKVLGVDPLTGAAMVKVDKTGLPVLELGDSDTVQPGALVVSVNSQAGMRNSASLGMVAGTRRQLSAGVDMIQVSGTVGPGASGGPVLDAGGRVVAITSAMLSPSILPSIKIDMPKMLGSGNAPGNLPEGMVSWAKALQDTVGQGGAAAVASVLGSEALAEVLRKELADFGQLTGRTSSSSGFAIPINSIKAVLEKLKAGPVERGSIGALIAESKGKIVFGRVVPGTEAAQAGIKEGDVLVSADGRAFESLVEFTDYVRNHQPGEKMELVVLRDGKNVPVSVTVVKWAEQSTNMSFSIPYSSRSGIPRATFGLSLQNADIAEVAKGLSAASGKSVVVTEPEKITKKVTVELKSTTAEKALDVICRTLACRYSKDGDTYVISPK